MFFFSRVLSLVQPSGLERERERASASFKMTKKDEELDARTVERMEALEKRIGRFEESIKFIMAEFRQSVRAEMEKLLEVPTENPSFGGGVLPLPGEERSLDQELEGSKPMSHDGILAFYIQTE